MLGQNLCCLFVSVIDDRGNLFIDGLCDLLAIAALMTKVLPMNTSFSEPRNSGRPSRSYVFGHHLTGDVGGALDIIISAVLISPM
jgi:hypothetical protein